MITTPAWALPYQADRYIVVGLHYAVALLWQPRHWSLGGDKRWVSHDNKLVPLFDLSVLLKMPETLSAKPLNDVMLLRHFDDEQQLHTVAVHLHHKPELIYVADEDGCASPEDNEIWSMIAPSCVRHTLGVLPIVDPTLLFASTRPALCAQAL